MIVVGIEANKKLSIGHAPNLVKKKKKNHREVVFLCVKNVAEVFDVSFSIQYQSHTRPHCGVQLLCCVESALVSVKEFQSRSASPSAGI